MPDYVYPYAHENLLENQNTYFYAEYRGSGFIDEWRESRLSLLGSLPSEIAPEAAAVVDPDSELTDDLIEKAMSGDVELAEKFVGKFEITKRVHQAYDNDFRAVDREHHKNLGLYLRVADLFALLYSKSGSSRHLNVYLKCLDTLVGLHKFIETESMGRLAWHIRREQEFVEGVIEELELDL